MGVTVKLREPEIRVSDLCLRYPGMDATGREWALSNVNFHLAKSDRLGLLGRNGAGKSTLLRVLAGIYPPDRGRVEVTGRPVSIFNASLGFVPEASGWENIFLRCAAMGIRLEQAKALAHSIVEFAGIGEWIHRPLTQYSSGMALRLAFAITTTVEADILLMDEWLGVGDAEFLARARNRMMELVEQAGILVLATHNLQLMRRICNKAIIIDGGNVVDFGDIDEVADKFKGMTAAK